MTAGEVVKSTTPNTAAPQPGHSSNRPSSNVGVYFGPEAVIFTASLSDGDTIQVPLSPFAMCSDSNIFREDESLQVARNTGKLVNILAVLRQPTVPPEQP